ISPHVFSLYLTSLISPAVFAAWAYVPKLDMFLASLANVGLGADQQMVVGAMRVFEKWLWHKGQVAEVLWSQEEEMRDKVAAYIEPLVQMDLACQERKWVEAAAQSAAIMSAEREAELLEERRVALAELKAKRMADAWAAGF
ncbi:hypothetical protein C0992_005405, partial [Termitomyces sp. T32_za158]